MTSPAQQKSVRVIAANAKDRTHRTVNIVSSAPYDPHHSIKAHVQLTAAQTVPGVHETVQDSGGSITGLPTVFISGYAGPN